MLKGSPCVWGVHTLHNYLAQWDNVTLQSYLCDESAVVKKGRSQPTSAKGHNALYGFISNYIEVGPLFHSQYRKLCGSAIYVLVACVRVCVCVYVCMYTCVFKLPCRPVLQMSWQHHSTVINVSGSSEDQEIWRDTSAWAEAGRKRTQNQHKSSVKCVQGFSDGKVTWKDTSAGQLNENIFSVLILLTSGTASSRLTAVFKVQGSRCVPRYVVYECHYSW